YFTSLGALGIILAFLVQIIPSEVILAYAGYLVFTGKISFAVAVFAGTLGCILEQLMLYVVSRWAGRAFILRYGKYVGVKPTMLATAEQWFEKHGTPIVFFGRFVPMLRQPISIPAGLTNMNIFKFTFYTGLASL